MRPDTFDDLHKHEKVDHTVADFKLDQINVKRNIQLTAAMYDFLSAAENEGMTVHFQGDSITLTTPLTQKEKDQRLLMAQDTWDRWDSYYDKALEDPSALLEKGAHYRHMVDTHAKQEGYDPIDWGGES